MTAGSSLVAVLGEESSLSGRFVGQDLTVLGNFDGDLKANGVVRIGRQAAVKARIEAGAVEVEGVFEGEIRTGRLLFGATARARGVFLSDRLTIKDGAVVEGSVNQPQPPEARTTDQYAAEATISVAETAATAEPVVSETATEVPTQPDRDLSEAPPGFAYAALALPGLAPVTFAEAGLLASPSWQPRQHRRHRKGRHM
jgi:cytoskeletal protein CcmA (bactofilin family)